MSTLNRRGSRTKSLGTAKIKVGFFKKLDCEVRDVSPGGARLVPPPGVELPDAFVVKFSEFKRPRNCLLRWKSGSEVGVEFAPD